MLVTQPIPMAHTLTHTFSHTSTQPSVTNAAATSKNPDIPANLQSLLRTLLFAQSQTHLHREAGGRERERVGQIYVTSVKVRRNFALHPSFCWSIAICK